MTEVDWREVGRRVEAERVERGWSKEEAARRAGISSITWKRVEDGLRVQDVKLQTVLRTVEMGLGYSNTDGELVQQGLEAPTDPGAQDADVDDGTFGELRDFMHFPTWESKVLDHVLQMVQKDDRLQLGISALASIQADLPEPYASMPTEDAWYRLESEQARAEIDLRKRRRQYEEEQIQQVLERVRDKRRARTPAERERDGYTLAARTVPGAVPELKRQADEQDAEAYAPDPEGPEGGA